MANPGHRIFGPTTVAGIGLFLCSVVWFVVGLGHPWSTPALGWLPLPVMALIATWSCFLVTRRADLAAATRRFWRHMAVGCGILAVAVVSNAIDALTGPNAPSQYLSPRTIVLYLSIMCFVIWSLLRLPAWERSRADWARFGLDAAIVLITTGALAWHFSLREIEFWTTTTGSAAAPVLMIVGVAALSLITLMKVAFAGAGRLDRRALHLMSGGVGLAALSGALTPVILAKPYLSTSFLATTTAALTMEIAARRQLRAPAAVSARPVPRRYSVLPYAAIAALNCVLLSRVAEHGGEDLLIAICAVSLTALVAFRQVAALRENNRLLSAVDANLRRLSEYQKRLAHQVTTDPLTEIGNRALFVEQLTARLHAGESLHVALLDVDDFKVVNDRLGHGTGDALLKAISSRLRERLGDDDTLARLGGDEFTMLLPKRTDEQVAAMLTELLDGVRAPLLLDGHDLVAKISMGVTAARPGDSTGEVLRRADVAMYTAKSAGGGRWTWFDPIMDQLADDDARLGTDLRQALVRDELFLLYQPIVELPHGRLAGVEALLRWRHPRHGLIAPSVFIPLAERNGTIVELGRWVLREAVRQAAEWERRFGSRAPEKVSVNISARQLQEPGFAAEVAALLHEYGVTPHRIVAEVTETAVLGTGEALDAVRALHDLGLRVALDDFGTGQSSLSLLVDTPVRVLKVDKSFVDGVTMTSSEAVIVDGLIGITHGLRIEAVAEGVETAEQAIRLHEVGYQLAQGFHFARPMPAGDVAQLLENASRPAVPSDGNLDKVH